MFASSSREKKRNVDAKQEKRLRCKNNPLFGKKKTIKTLAMVSTCWINEEKFLLARLYGLYVKPMTKTRALAVSAVTHLADVKWIKKKKTTELAVLKLKTAGVIQPNRIRTMWLASLVLVYRWSRVMRLAGNTDSDWHQLRNCECLFDCFQDSGLLICTTANCCIVPQSLWVPGYDWPVDITIRAPIGCSGRQSRRRSALTVTEALVWPFWFLCALANIHGLEPEWTVMALHSC